MSEIRRWQNWCAASHGHELTEYDAGIYVLASDYDALRAQLAEAQRDAERYRWLREGNGYYPEEIGEPGGDRMDAAIDAALAKGKQP